jgi:hypothetical protein
MRNAPNATATATCHSMVGCDRRRVPGVIAAGSELRRGQAREHLYLAAGRTGTLDRLGLVDAGTKVRRCWSGPERDDPDTSSEGDRNHNEHDLEPHLQEFPLFTREPGDVVAHFVKFKGLTTNPNTPVLWSMYVAFAKPTGIAGSTPSWA